MKNLEDLKKQLGLTSEQMYRITALHLKGNSVETISKSTGIGKDKIREFLVARDRKPIEIERKNEPASSANNASSKVSDVSSECASSVLTDDYNKLQEKCQVLGNALRLAHKGIIAQYEEMTAEQQQAFDLGQLYAEIEYRMKQGGVEIDE